MLSGTSNPSHKSHAKELATAELLHFEEVFADLNKKFTGNEAADYAAALAYFQPHFGKRFRHGK